MSIGRLFVEAIGWLDYASNSCERILACNLGKSNGWGEKLVWERWRRNTSNLGVIDLDSA